MSTYSRIPDDRYHIVPQGAQGAMVRPLDLQIRIMAEYDISYMRDRVRADLFGNGHPLGISAVSTDHECYVGSPEPLVDAHGPELEQAILRELLGHERHRELEVQVQILHEQVRYLSRTRWWHLGTHWQGLKVRASDKAAVTLVALSKRVAP